MTLVVYVVRHRLAAGACKDSVDQFIPQLLNPDSLIMGNWCMRHRLFGYNILFVKVSVFGLECADALCRS